MNGHDDAAALGVAHALQHALEEPFALDTFLIPIQASIGVSSAPQHATTPEDLLRCADIAMYQAKAQQTGVEIYKATGDEHTRDRLLLVSELRHGLDNGELLLHYQPKVSIADRSVTGVEALVRWQHPRLGLLPPAEFVPLAEREGLIRLLTLEVLDQALAQQREWRRTGVDISVAVNLSPANLLDTRLPDDLAALLTKHETPPQQLELEITESTLMRDPERALDILARISELGVGFALDDFGTGYSSLAQLRHLPVSALKIDRSFITHMTESAEDASIVRSTIQLGRSLNLQVVAEGVESAEHLSALEEFGCHTVQGFYLSRPIPAEAVTDWMRAYRPADPAAGLGAPVSGPG